MLQRLECASSATLTAGVPAIILSSGRHQRHLAETAVSCAPALPSRHHYEHPRAQIKTHF